MISTDTPKDLLYTPEIQNNYARNIYARDKKEKKQDQYLEYIFRPRFNG